MSQRTRSLFHICSCRTCALLSDSTLFPRRGVSTPGVHRCAAADSLQDVGIVTFFASRFSTAYQEKCASACAAIVSERVRGRTVYVCVHVRHSSQCGCGKQRVPSVWYSSAAHTASDGWESSAVMSDQEKSQLRPPPHHPLNAPLPPLIRRRRTVLTHGDGKTRSQRMIARWVGGWGGVGGEGVF